MGAKVSVILICHNQAPYVEQAIRSVLMQESVDLELIVIDDNSTDNSRVRIQQALSEHPEVEIIFNDETRGNCYSFNRAFSHSQGQYIIDLAADDYFLPGKLSSQVEKFEELSSDHGVVYTDAELVDGSGNSLGKHSERIVRIGKVAMMPEGLIWRELLSMYFIAAPTQMMRRSMLEDIGGYDEDLSYEDFDLWVRSSKSWKYAYLPEASMVIRKLSSGMSSNMYGSSDQKVWSTLKVMEKALKLAEDKPDAEAVRSRIKYELRMAFKHRNRPYARSCYNLLRRSGKGSLPYYLMSKLA